MYTKRIFKRVTVLVLVLVTAPLAIAGPGPGAAEPLSISINDGCATTGTCCYRPGSICRGDHPGPEDDLIDHYYEPSGSCPPSDSIPHTGR